jgi:hypothetical protein
MNTRRFHHASLRIAMLVLAVTVALAQTPSTQTTTNTKVSGKSEFRLTPLQTQPQKRAAFAL